MDRDWRATVHDVELDVTERLRTQEQRVGWRLLGGEAEMGRAGHSATGENLRSP